jgi:hypothetical protein
MRQVMVRYAELARVSPDGLHYATFRFTWSSS